MLLFAAGAAAATEAPRVRRFGVEDGLSHNAVHALAQDADGFLWIGTQDGLNRFDGLEFRRFAHAPEAADLGPFVVALQVDSADRLWVGTRRGLGLLAPGLRRPQAIDLGQPHQPSQIVALVRSGDSLWIGTGRGLYALAPDASPATAATLVQPGVQVRAIAAEAQDAVWVLSGEQDCELRRHTRAGPAGPALPAPCAYGMALAPDGRLALGPETHWHPDAPSAIAAGSLPWWVLRDGDRLLYAGLTGVEIAAPGATPEPVWPLTDRRHARPLANEIRALLRDRDGALWLGTYDGLFALDPKAPRFAALGAGGPAHDALAALHVSALLPDGERWLLGSYGEGVFTWQETQLRLARLDADPGCPDFVWTLARDSQGVPVVNGACSVRGDRVLADRPALAVAAAAPSADRPSPGPPDVRASLLGRDGQLWLASTQGLFRARDGAPERVLDGGYEALALAPDGSLWLAPNTDLDPQRADRLLRFDPQSGQMQAHRLPAGEDVFDLLADASGVWAATGAGLLRVDESGRLRRWLPDETHAGRVFYSLLRGVDGALWIGTSRGLLRFDPSQQDAGFRHFDHRDGVPNLEFNRRSRWQDASGRLWFGGMNGVVSFDPRGAVPAPVRSRVRIDSVRVLAPDGERELAPGAGGILELAHDDAGLSLGFVAPGFRRAERFVYRYRLLGLDPQWIDSRGRRDARFTRLAPGAYRFEVVAGDETDAQRFGQAGLEIAVAPPWYARGWFRLTLAAGLVGLVWLGYRLRVAHLLSLQRMRLDIASNLHDELGSELAAIGVGAAMVERSAGLSPRDRQRLSGIGQSAAQVAQALRDIVWVVNPDKDRLDELVARMRSFAAELLAGHELRFTAPPTGLERTIPMEIRHDVHLVFKEAMGNIARHARAARVAVELAVAADRLRLHIEDDGIGFVPGRHSGTGLASMRRRADALGGTLDIDSAPGRGTRIELIVPLTRTRRGGRARSGG